MQAATLPAPRTAWPARLAAVSQRRLLLALTVIVTLMRIGGYWDVHWHVVVGRDSFWIPPHDLIYAGVALSGLLGLFVVARNGWRRRWAAPRPWTWALIMAGAGLMVVVAPLDDLWHRLYGLDVTLWSPPHVAGILGGCLINWGVVTSWVEHYHSSATPSAAQRALLGVAWSGAVLLSMVNFLLLPASRWSVVQPVSAVLYALYGGLAVTFTLLAVTLLGRRWWLPLAVVGAALALRLVDSAAHALSTALIVPLYTDRLRDAPDVLFMNYTAAIFLNAVPALVLALLAWRVRRWSWGRAAGVGLLGGAAVLVAILLGRSGLIIPTHAIVITGDYQTDVVPTIRRLAGAMHWRRSTRLRAAHSRACWRWRWPA